MVFQFLQVLQHEPLRPRPVALWVVKVSYGTFKLGNQERGLRGFCSAQHQVFQDLDRPLLLPLKNLRTGVRVALDLRFQNANLFQRCAHIQSVLKFTFPWLSQKRASTDQTL
jgi:hypothetical protein